VLADGPSKRTQRLATVTFCAATPLGIVGGSALLVSTSCTVIAPISAFSAGSLVWVALHEVISPATASSVVDIVLVLCALWLGFGAMTLLAVWM
jgi:zinc transporter ZupT